MKNSIFSWKKVSCLAVMLVMLMTACGDAEENNTDENGAVNDNNTVNNEGSDNGANNNEANNNEANNNEEDSNDEAAGEFPVTVTDTAEREVTIEEEPETIVTLIPSNTEIIFELGVGDKLIGISDYCNYPEETADIETVGGQDMDAELILSLEPDMLFLQHYHLENHQDMIDQFEESGIDILVVDGAESFERAYDSIRIIGDVTGTSSEAESVVAGMQERLDEISAQADESISEDDQKTVWVEIAPSPDIFTTGQGTFMHEMLETINAVNAAEDQEGWVNLSEEEVVSLEPDVIVTTYGFYIDDPVEEVLSRDGWSEVPAVQDERIYDVDNDTVTRPGPRLVEGVEMLAEFIYPDVFE